MPGQPIQEGADREKISVSGSFRDHRSIYKIVSEGYYSGKAATIEIDGIHYSKNSRGFNIVVYDNLTMKVIDKVCFDTGGSGAAIR